MASAKVIRGFKFKEKELQVGDDFIADERTMERFRRMGFVQFFETKAETKKDKDRSESLSAAPPVRRSKKKTAKKPTKKQTK